MKAPRMLCLMLSIACAGLLFSTHALSELKRNPFENKSEVINKKKITAVAESVASKKGPPRITSIIVAGSASLIMSGGEHYRIGERLDGYILAEVYENGARFIKNGRTIDVKIVDDKIE